MVTRLIQNIKCLAIIGLVSFISPNEGNPRCASIIRIITYANIINETLQELELSKVQYSLNISSQIGSARNIKRHLRQIIQMPTRIFLQDSYAELAEDCQELGNACKCQKKLRASTSQSSKLCRKSRRMCQEYVRDLINDIREMKNFSSPSATSLWSRKMRCNVRNSNTLLNGFQYFHDKQFQALGNISNKLARLSKHFNKKYTTAC